VRGYACARGVGIKDYARQAPCGLAGQLLPLFRTCRPQVATGGSEMTAARTETFGLLSPASPFSNIDEAIQIYNGTPFGLSSGLCTKAQGQEAIKSFCNEKTFRSLGPASERHADHDCAAVNFDNSGNRYNCGYVK
jgi:hypothetical protein